MTRTEWGLYRVSSYPHYAEMGITSSSAKPLNPGMSQQTPSFSKRAQHRFDNEVHPPLRHFIPGKYYDKEHPDGVINLSTAENSLMAAELLEYMQSHFKLTPAHLKYRSSITHGYCASTIEALPHYINAYAKPITPVTPAHTVPGPGLGALLAQFIWTVCDAGEGVLMSTPYYADYPRDIIYPARAKVVAAHIPPDVDSLGVDSMKYVRDTIEQSNSAGIRVRVLILCNPHNPLAKAYPVETIIEYAKVAEEYNLHLLVDEVYANQVFASSLVPNPAPFVSILSLDVAALAGCAPSRIHLLAGPTKDFGASGIKVGAFVSQHNPAMVELMEASLGAIPVSSASDALFTPIMNDDVFRTWFLEENRNRLSRAFERVADWCTFHSIPFLPASAGVYFLLDLHPVISKLGDSSASLDEKIDLAVTAMLENGVFMRPTTGSEDHIATRFRMTFTLVPETMLIALERLEKAFGLKQWSE